MKCFNCGGTINEKKDRYVSLLTNEGEQLIEEKYFHINCWKTYFQERISQGAQTIVSNTAKKAACMLGQVLGGMGTTKYEI